MISKGIHEMHSASLQHPGHMQTEERQCSRETNLTLYDSLHASHLMLRLAPFDVQSHADTQRFRTPY